MKKMNNFKKMSRTELKNFKGGLSWFRCMTRAIQWPWQGESTDRPQDWDACRAASSVDELN